MTRFLLTLCALLLLLVSPKAEVISGLLKSDGWHQHVYTDSGWITEYPPVPVSPKTQCEPTRPVINAFQGLATGLDSADIASAIHGPQNQINSTMNIPPEHWRDFGIMVPDIERICKEYTKTCHVPRVDTVYDTVIVHDTVTTGGVTILYHTVVHDTVTVYAKPPCEHEWEWEYNCGDSNDSTTWYTIWSRNYDSYWWQAVYGCAKSGAYRCIYCGETRKRKE
jgi:hypothetical protein